MFKQFLKEIVANAVAPMAIMAAVAGIIYLTQGLFKEEAVKVTEQGFEEIVEPEKFRKPASADLDVGDLVVTDKRTQVFDGATEGEGDYREVILEEEGEAVESVGGQEPPANSRRPSSRIRTSSNTAGGDGTSSGGETNPNENPLIEEDDDDNGDGTVDGSDNDDDTITAVGNGNGNGEGDGGDPEFCVLNPSDPNCNSGGSGGGPTGGGGDPVIVGVSADKVSGYYSTNPLVSLSCTNCSTIKYDSSPGACGVLPTPATTYSTPVTVGGGDGIFCLSIQAYDGSAYSTIKGYEYTVDSTLPANNIVFNATHLQTSEAFSFSFNSTAPWLGDPNTNYSLLNLPSVPVGTCQDNDLTPPIGSFLMDIDNDNLSEKLAMNSLPLPISMNDIVYTPLLDVLTPLRYGDNFLMSILEDTNPIDASKYSCPTTNVILEDFFIQDITMTGGSLPVNIQNQRELSGGFTNFGFFRAPAQIGGPDTSGNGKHQVSTTNVLENGIINIVN